jgi:hypothetical protein
VRNNFAEGDPNPDLSPPPEVVYDFNAVKAASDLLSEMQTRVSFVGPMIGFGAAQQAAKNNGLNYNKIYGEAIEYHYSMLEDGGEYSDEDVVPQIINNYEWRPAYRDMLYSIMKRTMTDGVQGIAVSPSGHFMAAPNLTGDSPLTGYLDNEWMYSAVNDNYWCAIKDMLYYAYFDTESKWWGNIDVEKNSGGFPGESEYFCLNLKFFQGTLPYSLAIDDTSAGATNALHSFTDDRTDLTPITDEYDRYDPIYTNDEDNKWDILPYISWAIYDWHWSNYSDTKTKAWAKY